MSKVTVVVGGHPKTYHTDPDCHIAQQAAMTDRKDRSKLNGRYQQCTFCCDEFDPVGSNAHHECPKCGEEVSLPVHLPKCDAGDAL